MKKAKEAIASQMPCRFILGGTFVVQIESARGSKGPWQSILYIEFIEKRLECSSFHTTLSQPSAGTTSSSS
jgi:thiamine phosphate synthase YjbQ (UPF0047 family)